jgi:hypothetical protein
LFFAPLFRQANTNQTRRILCAEKRKLSRGDLRAYLGFPSSLGSYRAPGLTKSATTPVVSLELKRRRADDPEFSDGISGISSGIAETAAAAETRVREADLMPPPTAIVGRRSELRGAPLSAKKRVPPATFSKNLFRRKNQPKLAKS